MPVVQCSYDTGIAIRRFLVLALIGLWGYVWGARRSSIALAPARFLLQQVPGRFMFPHWPIPPLASGF